MSIFPRNCSKLATLTRRFMKELQSGQIAIRFPIVSVTYWYSTIPPAGSFGAWQRTQ